MGTVILFSKVGVAAAEFPGFVNDLQEIFAQHGLHVGCPDAVEELAFVVQRESVFRQNLASILGRLCLRAPGISYLELLGIMLAAAAGEEGSAELAYLPALQEPVCSLFSFVVEACPSRPEREEPAQREGRRERVFEEPPRFQVRSAENGTGVPAGGTEMTFYEDQEGPGSRLARALAFAAEEEFPGEPSSRTRVAPRVSDNGKHIGVLGNLRLPEDLHLPEDLNPAEDVDAPEDIEEPSYLAEQEREMDGARRRLPIWIAGAGGLLLGSALEFFVQGRRAVPPAAQLPAAAEQTTDTKARLSPADNLARAADLQREAMAALAQAGPVHGNSQSSVMDDSAEAPGVAVAEDHRGDIQPHAAPNSSAATEGSIPGPAERSGPPVAGTLVPVPTVLLKSAGIMAGNLISSPMPVYPPQASAAGVQGEVLISAVVGRDGNVIESHVVSGPPLLREAALNAVQHWRYRPFAPGGKPMQIITTARVEFHLSGH